jgi:hypothetical protein
MSVKLTNNKTGETATCEAVNWTLCRDHKPNLGWEIFTPKATTVDLKEDSIESVTLAEYEKENNPSQRPTQWEATVSFYLISTGEKAAEDEFYTGKDRISVENQLTKFYNGAIDTRTTYFTVFFESPLGIFMADPSGWGRINLERRMYGRGTKS